MLAIPAGISANRPEISRRASAQREVESAIILTWYPISRKYSDNVIPGRQEKLMNEKGDQHCIGNIAWEAA